MQRSPDNETEKIEPQILLLSARDNIRLKEYANNLLSYLEKMQATREAVSLVNIAYTLQVGRDAMNERMACVVSSITAFQSILAQGEGFSDKVYRGNAKRDKEKLRTFLNGYELSDRISSAHKAGRLYELAELWAYGASIDWVSLFYGPEKRTTPFRVALPTYPFARTLYKPSYPDQSKQSKDGIHPLLNSTSEDGEFVITLSGNEFCLTDHIIQGQSILPGAAYIEIARAAGERYLHIATPKISSLVWLAPVVFTGTPLELRLSFRQNAQMLEFEITSGDAQARKHCIGRLGLNEHSSNQQHTDIIPLEEIKQRCSALKTRADCYDLLRARNLNYGPAFQVLEQFSCNQQEALSLLKLPEKVRDERLQLHPSLIDGALQTALLFDVENADTAQLSIPYSVAEIVMHRPLPAQCYVYVTPSTAQSQTSKGSTRDLLLLDDIGRIIVSLRGVSARPLERKRSLETEQAIHYYQAEWMPAENQISAVPHISPDAQILLVDAGHLSRDLTDRGYTVTKTTLSVLSKDHGNFLEALPDYIVLSLPADIHRAISYKDLIQQDFASFFAFCQVLCSRSLKKRVKLLCTYTNREEEPSRSVVYRALASFLVSIRRENPKIDVAMLEMQVTDEAAQRMGSIGELVLEILQSSEPFTEMRAVLRRGAWEKYIRHIKSIQLTRPQLPTLPLKERGVYLITGGMGKIGLLFAEYLANQVHARLVLIGRTALTDPMRDKLTKLERLGAEVIYIRADIAQRSEVRTLLHTARSRFGHLDGIIHAAGVLRDSLLIRKTWEQVDSVLAPKVLGTVYMDEETREDHLDFFVLCSSLVATLGNVGQCDYAYANRFMDEYALMRKEAGHGHVDSTRYVSISWPLWRDGGMSVSREAEERLKETMGMIPMSSPQGFEAFERILSSHLSHVLVVTGLAEKLDRTFVDADGRASRLNTISQPQQQKVLAHAHGNQVTESQHKDEEMRLKEWILKHIKTIVSSETRTPVEGIDTEEALETYGIDSLLVVSITHRLEETFGELSKTLLFEYQTIAELARYFLENQREEILKHLPSARSDAEAAHSDTEVTPVPGTEQALTLSSSEAAVFKKVEESMQKEPIIPREPLDDIAIIGMAGQFPMAKDVHEFWNNLKEGQDCITEIPLDRWDYRAFPEVLKWGGFMEDVDKFDPLFFNISNREAEWLDPQERLFLQVVYHTLEDAGYNKKTLANAHVGVYVGLMWGQYQLYGAEKANAASSYGSIANRVSYYFNFRGPSIALDTMCSSSLVSIHLACESLKSGETDVAIAGGVNVNVHPNKHIFLSTRGFAASDGRCRSFGVGGDGYVPGEGIAAVLLKPLSKARRDGDRIYGVIKATATNHGGKTNGYTVPNPQAQGHLIADALEKSRLDPGTISYIEAHGTGTALGDPIEITGLNNAFKPHTTDTQFCSIGSVKSNIGHLEGAAGVAGVIKVLLQMQHRQLVPSIHSQTLNPNIDFAKTPFYVQRELTDWNRPTDEKTGILKQYPRRAGVSSFGAGGANAHLILEEDIPAVPAQTAQLEEAYLVTFSARDKERLQEYAHSLLTFLKVSSQTREIPPRKEEVRGENERLDIQTRLHQCIAEVLGVSPQFIDDEDLFEDYGLSSTQLYGLIEKIGEALGAHLPVEILERQRSIQELSQYLFQTSSEWSGRNGNDEVASIESSLTLANLAYTFQTGREAMEEGFAIVASSLNEFIDLLTQIVAGQYQIEGIYERSLRMSRSAGVVDGESQEFLNGLMKNRRLHKLAKLWSKGVDIDWRRMYDPHMYTRISLPLYPFAKERCWVSDPTLSLPGSSLQTLPVHPLLDRIHPGRSLGTGIAFEKTFISDDPLVRDYTVNDIATLSHAVSLGLADAALSTTGRIADFELQTMRWLTPLTIGETRQIMVHLSEESSRALQMNVEADGKIYLKATFASGKKQAQDTQPVLLDEIRKRCQIEEDAGKIYARFAAIGVAYGEYYRILNSQLVSDTEALATFSVPGQFQGREQQRLLLALLEALFQTTHTFIPVPTIQSVGSLQILRELPSSGYAYVRFVGNGLCHATILDSHGLVCLRLQDIQREAPLLESSPTESSSTESPPIELSSTVSAPAWQESVLQRIFYAPQWVEDTTPWRKGISEKVLIIYAEDSRPLKQTLVDSLIGNKIFEIVLGKTTRLLSQNCWEIDPRDSDAIVLCLSYIEKLDVVYFLGGIYAEKSGIESNAFYKQSQEQGLRALLSLAKAFHTQKTSTHTIQLKIVTNNVYQVKPGEQTHPFAASMIGLGRVITKEYPAIKTSLIDLDLSMKETGNALPVFTREQLTRLIGESEIQESAIRNNVVYKRILIPIDVPSTNIMPFKQNGCYIIFGGTGNVGLKVSLYLAKTSGARLAWFGRKALNQKIREKMEQVREAGGEVQYFPVDITHEDEVLKAMRIIESHWGGIHGVFHSAMDFRFARLHDLDDAGLQEAIGAKVAGTLTLQRVLRKIAVSFVVLFSSGEALTTGNAGWGAYGAACSFQDALGLFMDEQEAYRTHIINWGYWEDNERGDVAILKAKGIYPLNAANGMEALRRILAQGRHQALVLDVEDRILTLMGVDLSRRRSPNGLDQRKTGQGTEKLSLATPSTPLVQQSIATPLPEPVAQRREPELSTADLAAQINEYLIDIISEALKIDKAKFDPEVDLGYYGVDSLLVISLHKELEEKLGKLPATLLIEYPSIKALGQFLLDNHRDLVERTMRQSSNGHIPPAPIEEVLPIVDLPMQKGTNGHIPPAPIEEISVADLPKQREVNGHTALALVEEVSTVDLAAQINEYLIDIISEALKIDKAKFDPEVDLGYYGVDSLLVISLHKELEEKLGKLPATLLIEYPSIKALGQFLLDNHRDLVERTMRQSSNGHSASAPVEEVLNRPIVTYISVNQAGSDKPANVPVVPNDNLAVFGNPDVRIIRVVKRSLIPQFLENYGDEYRNKTLAKGGSTPDEQLQISRIDDQLVQLMVKTSWDKEIEVIVAGSGIPLLFMPAVALTAPVWYHQFKALTPGYQAIVIHAPGFGLSEVIGEISTKAVGNLFVEVLDRLKIRRPIHLVASCFGSIAAQYIAKEYQEKVASMTLCGGFYDNIGFPEVDPSTLSIEDVFALTATASASLKNDFDNLINKLEGKNPQAEAHYQWCSDLLLNSQCANSLIGMRYLNELLTLSTLSWLPGIAAPTLCIAGTEDTVVDPQASRTISAKIPFARLLEVPNAAHYPFLTHPETFNTQLIGHIQEQELRLSGQK